MRKIKLSHDMNIPGWGWLRQGQEFKVESYNSRFVYVLLADRVRLRLARKADCIKVY